MYKQSYLFKSQWNEIRYHWKLSLIVFLSLVFSFTLVIVFTGKLIDVAEQKSLSRLLNQDQSVLLTLSDPKDSPILDDLQVEMTDHEWARLSDYKVNFKTDQDSFIEYLTVLKGQPQHFIQMKNFDGQLADGEIAVSNYQARKHNLKIGQELKIGSQTYRISQIFSSYQFNRRIILNDEPHLVDQSQFVSEKFYIQQVDKEKLQALISGKEISLKDLNIVDHENSQFLTQYLLLIASFSLSFIVLSMINCLLVFYGKLKHTQKNLAVKKLFGLKPLDILQTMFIENGILSLFAFNIAFLLVIICQQWIPSNIATDISLLLYEICLVEGLVMSILYAIYLSGKLSKNKLIDLLKGAAQ